MVKNFFQEISDALVNGEKDAVLQLTVDALAAGQEPMQIIDAGLAAGMGIVGQKYESGEYFLPHLILAADAMKKAMRLLEPELHKRNQQVQARGVVVIGTVAGDIHEIGKTLVATMLSANGYQVHDLGVDVPVDAFIAKVQETRADLLGLSALLTTTMTIQRNVIAALQKATLRRQVKVMVGGAPVSKQWADTIGADGYAQDAVSTLRLAAELLGAK